tara:strand:- start:21 stop:266 length:246 start_codon:yes stop_codon:yes gene_type:complete
MAITVTLKGTDLKFSNGTSIEYYPVSQVKQKVVGTNIEIWRGGELVRSDDASDCGYMAKVGTGTGEVEVDFEILLIDNNYL